MTEHEIQQRILLACGKGPSRLWRNNVALAWTGKAIKLDGGDVLIRNARPLHAGLCKGSADLIGLRTVTIGPEHVGQRLAVFCAIEVKSATGRPTREQTAFLALVREMGGLAGIARVVDDAAGILNYP